MIKRLFLCALMCLALTCGAATTYEFSYVDNCENYIGISSAETYDVAIFLPGDLYKGYKVVSLTAPVNGSKSKYKDVCVWAATELKTSGGVNVTDVSYDASITNGNVTLEFPEAYTIPEKGAYLGFSVTVRSLDMSEGTRFPIGFGYPANPNGFWIRTSKSVPAWTNLALEQGISAAITLGVQSDNIEPESVMISEAPANIYAKVGEKGSAEFTMSTFGSTPVSSVDVDFTIAGVTSSCHYDLPEPTPVRLGKSFTVPVEIPAQSEKLSEDVEFTVTKVNGVANKSTDPSAISAVHVMSDIPRHQALFEEYTCVKCPYCTRGFAALEYIRENYPDFVTASYHNTMQGSDPMACVDNFPNNVSGNPYAFIARSIGCDPYYGTQTYSTILPVVDDIKAVNNQITPWEVKVSYSWDSDDLLVAKADVRSYTAQKGDFKIAYILVADSLQGKSTSWIQSNGYSSYAQDPDCIPQLNDFCRGGKYGKSSVRLVFNDVVISGEGIHGVAGSVPESLAAEETVSHSFTYDLSKVSSLIRQQLDKKNLRIIAVLLDKDGVALNCAKVEVNKDFSAAEGIEAEYPDAPVEYYDLNGVKVSNPSGGLFIRRQGNRTSKVVIK